MSERTNFRTLISPKPRKLWSSFLHQKIAHCMMDLQPKNELQSEEHMRTVAQNTHAPSEKVNIRTNESND